MSQGNYGTRAENVAVLSSDDEIVASFWQELMHVCSNFPVSADLLLRGGTLTAPSLQQYPN